MASTYALCEKCQKMNRVQLNESKEPICGNCKSSLPIDGAIIEGHDRSFQTLIQKSPAPVVVDIWAPWCGPCLAFAPTFEEFSKEYAGKFVFVKLNSDENQRTSSQLGVRGIPTLVIFKDGQEVTRQSGALPRDYFSQWLNQNSK